MVPSSPLLWQACCVKRTIIQSFNEIVVSCEHYTYGEGQEDREVLNNFPVILFSYELCDGLPWCLREPSNSYLPFGFPFNQTS